jgi:hypothetical protein
MSFVFIFKKFSRDLFTHPLMKYVLSITNRGASPNYLEVLLKLRVSISESIFPNHYAAI